MMELSAHVSAAVSLLAAKPLICKSNLVHFGALLSQAAACGKETAASDYH
jgi:hypothetical protein